MIRVVVADDHPMVRDGLRALLTSLPNTNLVGEAATGRQAVRAAVTERPDVLVMDLHMPELDGVAATAEITRLAPGVAVLVLSMLDDDDSLFAAIRAGARGYLVKGAGQEEIIRAITAVASGDVIFGPGIARHVLTYFATPRPTQPTFPELTTREREILDLVAAGLSNATIAARLGLSTKTVGNNTSTIFTKLHVADRAEAIVRAREAGLGRT